MTRLSVIKLQYRIKQFNNGTFSINAVINNDSNDCPDKIHVLEIRYDRSDISEPVELGVPIENVTCLMVSHCSLSYLPPEFQFCNLNELDVSYNSFKEIPSFLIHSNFNLQKLNLSHNKIENFNSKLKCSSNLQNLDVSNNFISEIPEWIFNSDCTALEILNFSTNPLQTNLTSVLSGHGLVKLNNLELNNSNIRAKFIHEIPNLKKLSISNNEDNYCLNTMKELPFINIQPTSTLVELHMKRLGMSDINEEICSLSSLEIINISFNYISWLPQSFTKLKSLKVLNISNNELLTLPADIDELDNLTELHIAHNMVGSLPKNLVNLTHLELLDCYHNDLIDDSLLVVNNITTLVAFDIEQNCFSMTEDSTYLEQRSNIWKDKMDRIAGCRNNYTSDEDQDEDSSKCVSSKSNDYESDDDLGTEVEILKDHVEENWDLETESIGDDSMLVLPPYKFMCRKRPKPYDPSDFVDPIYFEDAIEDET